jgi:hypothetical protein
LKNRFSLEEDHLKYSGTALWSMRRYDLHHIPPSLDEFRNFFLGNDISDIVEEYSSIVV